MFQVHSLDVETLPICQPLSTPCLLDYRDDAGNYEDPTSNNMACASFGAYALSPNPYGVRTRLNYNAECQEQS